MPSLLSSSLPQMSPLLFSLIFSLMLCAIIADEPPPSPGYYPGSKVSPVSFDQAYRNLWGPQHQKVDQSGSLTIWLDSYSGSGFKSLRSYRSGYFGAAIKLQSGYTAGVNTNIYLSNNQDYPGDHDEVDIEFLGTTPDKQYVLQTNVFVRGSGDRNNVIGREIRFHLWFDPTQDFHNYAILWTPTQIIFLVDDVPIRNYRRKDDETFPERAMYVYGSIWDASPWATENGKYKADYKYEPFIGRYKDFKMKGCSSESSSSCSPPSASPPGYNTLSPEQNDAMEWVQNNYLVYDYCRDPTRDHTLTPEC
ncbi:Xyloglucan endotransglucosylase/hydrolase protein 31 [Stylosanthes scabra]|uniref:Xyloglucan endotransglucosylase/hydrolase n=1 Tax=Stylosanthes scabra TaxID=79078 RepID=A0ABU6WGU7_9FABA|nr:Xyloglucan endotransglucosylase/hydrolase protein 31 [Stylosanthes scabra]